MLPAGNQEYRPVILKLNHNIEIAHRLLNLPGKCQQIHGHSINVTVRFFCEDSDSDGYALGHDGTLLEFGTLKKQIRDYLDTVWDHHLHLNRADPWARNLNTDPTNLDREHLPGLQIWPSDPSTENIARWIHSVVQQMVPGTTLAVELDETRTNGAEVG